MQQQLELSGITDNFCRPHHSKITRICLAPQCHNFKQLCQVCAEKDEHKLFCRDLTTAFQETEHMLSNVMTSLRAIKTKIVKEMDFTISNNPGLTEVENKLDEIRVKINHRIDLFHAKVKNIYIEHVREKLSELYEIVEKSEEFIMKSKADFVHTKDLRKFYLNDFMHEVKYYQSYLDEILKKKIKNFKTGVDPNKVFKMIVNFSKNLEEIFTLSKEPQQYKQKNHVFIGDSKGIKKYEMQLVNETPNLIKSVIHPDDVYENGYSWEGIANSIYYHPHDSFYFIGEGFKESKKVVKYESHDYQSSFRLLANLETERKGFAICLLNDEIYIIGGENKREGCTPKCQKFIPSSYKTYIISSLNQRSSHHSITTYKDRFILKFGGTNRVKGMEYKDSNSQSSTEPELRCNLLPQIYTLQTGEWTILEYEHLEPFFGLNFGLNPSLFKSQENNSIIVFGGEMSNTHSSRKIFRKKFDIKMEIGKQGIVAVKLKTEQISLHSKVQILPQTAQFENQKFMFLYRDTSKYDLPIELLSLSL